ncbi:MAG: hypothetical protein Q8J69_07785 [Sphingobacteriaceae bacterium]|nr:hypothetical protein [Sphingobacteriaceae bacterium]
MQLSQQQIELLNHCGQLLLPPNDVARLLQVDDDTITLMLKDRESAGFNAYHTGRLETELALRASILKYAKAGSSPAQTMAKQMLDSLKSCFDA